MHPLNVKHAKDAASLQPTETQEMNLHHLRNMFEKGHHAECCVKQRLCEEGEQRGYYRHRLFPCFPRKEKAMPVPKNKPTTLSSEGSTSPSSPVVPEQEEFRQYL